MDFPGSSRVGRGRQRALRRRVTRPALGERGDALHHRFPRGYRHPRRLDRATPVDEGEADPTTARAAASRVWCDGVGAGAVPSGGFLLPVRPAFCLVGLFRPRLVGAWSE